MKNNSDVKDQVKCPKCNGNGSVVKTSNGHGVWRRCPTCDGTGEFPEASQDSTPVSPRTQTIREQQRSGGQEVTAIMVSQDSIGVPLQPRFTEGGQELAVCKHCGHELIALSDPPYDRNWVHRKTHSNYTIYCQLETKAEPSEFEDNLSVEAADAYLRGEGAIKQCEVCGQDATLTNEFVTHLMTRHAEVVKERNALRDARVNSSTAAEIEREHNEASNRLRDIAGRKLAEVESLRAERAALREALEEVLRSGVEFDDPRVNYVIMQVDRDALAQARAALAVQKEN